MGEEAAIPLLESELLAQRGEIDHSHRHALSAETSGRVGHEGGLAHLAAGEHVAELTRYQARVKILIRPALDVGGGVGAQGAAGDIERTGWSTHGRGPSAAEGLTDAAAGASVSANGAACQSQIVWSR